MTNINLFGWVKSSSRGPSVLIRIEYDSFYRVIGTEKIPALSWSSFRGAGQIDGGVRYGPTATLL